MRKEKEQHALLCQQTLLITRMAIQLHTVRTEIMMFASQTGLDSTAFTESNSRILEVMGDLLNDLDIVDDDMSKMFDDVRKQALKVAGMGGNK